MGLHDRDYMRDTGGFRWSEIMWPDAVTTIVIVNALVFLLQHVFGVAVSPDPAGGVEPWGALSVQALISGRVWTIFTHLFVHDGILHVLGNCLMIFFAGKAVQQLIGSRHFLHIYFVAGLVGAALELLAGWFTHRMMPITGATAAALGTFVALAVILPQETVASALHFIFPIRVRLWILAMVLVGASCVLSLLQVTNVLLLSWQSFAHLGGAVAGWWFARILDFGGPPVTYDDIWQERQKRDEKRAYVGARKRTRTRETREAEGGSAPLTKEQFIAQEIDPILDKIHAHGIDSLSDEERKLLAKASEEVSKRKG